MPTLVLVRHGQSLWNLENRFTGWVDVPLTDTGRAEARRAGELLKGFRFQVAYTSVLSRAEETLSIVLDTMGVRLPIIRDQALNERHYGDLQGLNKEDTAKRYGADQVKLWRRSYDVPPPNGESLELTAKRTLPFFDRCIAGDLRQGKNVLVVANETVIGEPLLARIRERAQRGPASFLIIAPQSDPTQADHPEAERRLRRALTILRADGIDAHGQVAHPDPFTAATQAVQDERIDEIIVSTFAPSKSPWLRRDLIQRLHKATNLPVEHVVLEEEAAVR